MYRPPAWGNLLGSANGESAHRVGHPPNASTNHTGHNLPSLLEPSCSFQWQINGTRCQLQSPHPTRTAHPPVLIWPRVQMPVAP